MINKKFFSKVKILIILLGLFLTIVTIGVLGTQFIRQAYANEQEGQFYQTINKYSAGEFVAGYQVPASQEQVVEFQNLQNNDFQPVTSRTMYLPPVWDGVTMIDFRTHTYQEGDGSEDNPWQISHASELAFLAWATNNDSCYYFSYDQYFILTNNIYLNDVESWEWEYISNFFTGSSPLVMALLNYRIDSFGMNRWIPIGSNGASYSSIPFYGTFDGAGYVIKGMLAVGEGSQGLFGNMSNATVKNVVLELSIVAGTFFSGSIVGYMSNNSSVINSRNNGIVGVMGLHSHSGGLVGIAMMGSRIIHSFNAGNIFVGNIIGSTGAFVNIGGIVGRASSSVIADSRNEANISQRANNLIQVGGIAGDFGWSSIIINCSNIGDIAGHNGGSGSMAGGIAGGIQNWMNIIIANSYNRGNIHNFDTIGGIVSRIGANNTLINNYSISTIRTVRHHLGSIVGRVYSQNVQIRHNNGNTALFGFSPSNFIDNVMINTLPLLLTRLNNNRGDYISHGEQQFYFAPWRLGENGFPTHSMLLTVVLNRGEGVTTGDTCFTIARGDSLPVDLEAPTRHGFRFLGYYTTLSGGIRVFDADMVPITNLWTSQYYKTLYARWSPFTFIYRIVNVGNGMFLVLEVDSLDNQNVTFVVVENVCFQGAFDAINKDSGGNAVVIIFG